MNETGGVTIQTLVDAHKQRRHQPRPESVTEAVNLEIVLKCGTVIRVNSEAQLALLPSIISTLEKR
jgi:hypothetical protein